MTGSLTYHVGDGWMRRTFTAPKSLEGQHLQLRIGAIDDIDWVWINGRLVGSTGTDVQNYWMAPREYTIPDGVIHFGRENEIVVGIRNLRDDAGIWRGRWKSAAASRCASNSPVGRASCFRSPIRRPRFR